jgi:hypothetical protein
MYPMHCCDVLIAEGWFNSFVGQQDYKTSWLPIEPLQPDG